jgi:hypothetical protein
MNLFTEIQRWARLWTGYVKIRLECVMYVCTYIYGSVRLNAAFLIVKSGHCVVSRLPTTFADANFQYLTVRR